MVFRKDRSTGNLLAFLTESWSSSFRDFGETFAVGFEISRAFDRVWHNSLIFKLLSNRFYHSLCIFISSFLSGRSIAAVVAAHCSSPKPVNSGVPQGYVLSHRVSGVAREDTKGIPLSTPSKFQLNLTIFR